MGDRYRFALKKIWRANPSLAKQDRGIKRNLLLRMIEAQPQTLYGTCNCALLSIGYDFLTRRSELLALQGDDVEFLPSCGLLGDIRRGIYPGSSAPPHATDAREGHSAGDLSTTS